MKKSIKRLICAACIAVMLSACATIPRPTCPSDKDTPVCKIEKKGDRILANLTAERWN